MATIDGIDITSLNFQEGSAPGTPASTQWKLYTKTDGLYVIDDAGTETGPLGVGASSFSGARATKSAAQAITTATFTAITLTAEDFDTDSYHDNATNNTRFTVPTTAKYLVTGGGLWDGTSTNARQIRFRVNGTTYVDPYVATRGFSDASMSLTQIMALTAADYVELVVYQDSGGNRNFSNAALMISRLG